MNITKNQKGITLIALIITIVVLLILAVVAIGAAQESNIVGYAQNAAGKYEEAQANEMSLLATYETQLEALAAERIVLSVPGEDTKLTLFPSSGTVLFEKRLNGQTFSGNGKFTIEQPTEDDYFIGIGIELSIEGNKQTGIILVTENKEFYWEGIKLTVITDNVSDETMQDAFKKYTNTIGNNTIG